MDRFGFIHEKLDIKILILFILRRLPDEISGQQLADLTLIDDGIGYFDYMECLAELEDTGHITVNKGKYKVTVKGDKNGAAIESSIPYSVRSRAEREVMKLAAAMRRSAMIEASHTINEDGSPVISLSLSDGMGEIFSLRMLASDEVQSEAIERNFRAAAEKYYNNIVELLLDEGVQD